MSLILPMRGRIRSAAAVDYSTSNLVATLFPSNNEGFVCDVDYPDTLFQTNGGWGGMTAAASNGDPVALWLDVRGWGGDTLANVVAAASDIQTGYGTSVWSGGTNTVISDDSAVKITYVDSANETIVNLNDIATGTMGFQKVYVATFEVRVSTGASVTFRVSNGTNFDTTVTSTSYTTITCWFQKGTGSGYYQIRGLGSGESVWVRLTSIKQVPGSPFTAAGTARPTLTISGSDKYLLLDGTDDLMFVALNSAISQPWDRMSNLAQVSNTSGDHLFGGYFAIAGAIKQGTSPALISSDGSDGPTSSAAAIGSDVVMYERHDNTNSLLSINGEADNTGTTGTGAMGGVILGADYMGANNGNMRMRRVVQRSAFSASERALAYGWAAAA